MFNQYLTDVTWDTSLRNLGILKNSGLVSCGQKITSGAPAATANRFMRGCFIQNTATGICYIQTGTTASPVWEAIEAGTIALASARILVGNISGIATAVAMSGDATIANTGAVTVTGAALHFAVGGNIEVVGGVVNPGATLVAPFYSLGLPQALSGAGALTLTEYQTQFTSTATGNALTLADATHIGFVKKVSYIAEAAGGDTGVITPANASGFTTVTLNAIGDYVVFMWNGTDYIVIEYVGATVA